VEMKNCHLNPKPSHLAVCPLTWSAEKLADRRNRRRNRTSDTRSQFPPDYTDLALSSNMSLFLYQGPIHSSTIHPNWDLRVPQMLQTLSMKYESMRLLGMILQKSDVSALLSCRYFDYSLKVEAPDDHVKLTENRKFADLKFEILIRTILQHVWADFEHDKIYKSKNELPEDYQRELYLVSVQLETADRELANSRLLLKILECITMYVHYIHGWSAKIDRPITISIINDCSICEYFRS
jgi:hypothetical protein